jgi:nitrous oxide reductase accessory protein NosL
MVNLAVWHKTIYINTLFSTRSDCLCSLKGTAMPTWVSAAKHYMKPICMIGCLFLVVGTGWADGGGPTPAVKGLGHDGQMAISPVDRCPVCAMFPARYQQTAAAMVLKNGHVFYFCSNGCLIRAWLRPGRYLGKKRSDIHRLIVRDYFSGRPIEAASATWVAGSDVVGPMGPAVIALEDAGHLAAFKRRHGAKAVFTFDQINAELWERINQRGLPATTTE